MIQEIKDRVPVNVLSNNAIRYGIYDEQGNLLRYEYIKREDEPIEIGTPINRALFSNIQGDLYTQDRYNKPVVTSEERMVSEVSNTNIFTPSGWILVTAYTEYTRNGYELKASSGHSTYNPPSAFSGNAYWSANNGGAEAYLQIKLDSAKKINKIQGTITTTVASNNKTEFGAGFNGAKIQGSFEGEEWVDLYELTEPLDVSTGEITLNNTDYYLYYKIHFNQLSVTDFNAMIKALAVLEWEEIIPKTFYTNNLSLPLKSYEVGKIVNIEGSSYIEPQEVTKTDNIFANKAWTAEIENTKYISDDGYEIEASSTFSSARLPYYAFDDTTTELWQSGDSSTYGVEHWLKIKLPKAIKITKMNTYITDNNSNDYFVNAIIQGSKDNNEWIDLYETKEEQTELTEIALNNTDYYQYYRILGTNTPAEEGSARINVYEWQTSEFLEETEITSFENPYININNLGAKQINGTIKKGEKYSLVYNGESWDIRGTCVIGTFTGDGTKNRKIELGFTPSALIVYPPNGRLFYYNNGDNYFYGGIVANTGVGLNADGCPDMLKIVEGGFICSEQTSNYDSNHINQNGEIRYYIAFY